MNGDTRPSSRHHCRWKCSAENHASRRSLTVLFLLFSPSYAWGRGSTIGGLTNSLVCFVAPNNIQRCDHLRIRDHAPLSLSSKAKEEYCDTLQEEIVKKNQLDLQRQKMVQQKMPKKKRKRLRDHSKITQNDEPNARTKSKRRRDQHQKSKGSKSLSTLTVAQLMTGEVTSLSKTQVMPPWLSRYENEEFEASFDPDDVTIVLKAPPKTHDKDLSDEHVQSNEFSGNNPNIAAEKLKRLEKAMSGIFSETSKHTQQHHATSFTPGEIMEVLDSIRVASQDNINLIAGCADFLYLMLTLEEYETGDISHAPKTLIMTREVLVAAAFHYCDCVRARKAGVYDVVRVLMEAGGANGLEERLLPLQPDQYEQKRQSQQQNLVWLPPISNEKPPKEDDTAIVVTKTTVHRRGKSPIEKYGEETVRIAAGAAKLKRAEVMATTVNAKYDSRNFLELPTSQAKSKPTTANSLSSDASILCSFLVSLSDDWRVLVIQSAACLYRLKSIVDEGNNSVRSDNIGKMIYSSISMQTARDALRVYAPLAQRMGVQGLKSEIENTAFWILYRCQYNVASAFHDRDLTEMQAIIQVLTSRIKQLLINEDVFMVNVANVSVSSRVKEPFSLWKKILRFRKRSS
jgi:hypothetical protein